VTRDSIATAYHRLGRNDHAAAEYRRALELFQQLGDRFEQATTLGNLGDALAAGGDPAGARDAWARAAGIFESLGHRNAEPLRGKIAAVAA
jgi:Flp pilus assembly protein TadD